MWHQMGGRRTCTMLYGHIETPAQRVDHLRQLRELQDETRGFTGFVPFAFEPSAAHGMLAHIKRASAFEQLRNLAVSRIYLDNIDHLTAYWVSLGLPLAQVSLSYGVDDLHGTILEEKIFHMAGLTSANWFALEDHCYSVSSLRIGCVKYLNARPLIRGWLGGVEFDHPATLCKRLAKGELDVALVSSFEFLRNPIYRIVDDVSIS